MTIQQEIIVKEAIMFFIYKDWNFHLKLKLVKIIKIGGKKKCVKNV